MLGVEAQTSFGVGIFKEAVEMLTRFRNQLLSRGAIPALVLAVGLVSLVSACGSSNGDGECSKDSDCSKHCTYGPFLDGTTGSSTNGGFCAGGVCYCCYAQCDTDLSGTSSNCYCMSCTEADNCSSADMACYGTADVCLFFYSGN